MVLQFEYWPSITWVQQLILAEDWQLEYWGNYQKQSLANRCKITGANGLITLSVPLVAGREQKKLLKNIRIDNTQRWQVQHLRTIKSCYGKAPFFDHYFPSLEHILTQPYILLVELNTAIISFILKSLKLNTHIQLTESFQSATSFANSGYALPIKPYVQVFHDRNGFVPNLSILDALFCLGPQVVSFLKT